MKFISGYVAFALASFLLLASASSAASVITSKPVGAAYFMTNEPSGNYIVSVDIGYDGKLTFWNAVSTNGRGSHGVTTTPIGPDALFSQGSVQISRKANVIAIVNSGSDSISVFSIDEEIPSHLRLIQQVPSGGEFPMSVAFNEDGSMLCALNGGRVAGILCYAVYPHALVVIPDTHRPIPLNQTTPPAGPGGTASQITFSRDGKHLIAAIKGTPPIPGYLAVWDVVEGKGLSKSFTKIAPPKGSLLPFTLTPIPGGNAFFAADPGLGYEILNFTSGFKNITGSSAVAIKGQKAVCWSAYSPESGNYYAIDASLSTVTEVTVNSDLKSGVVKQYVTPNNSSIIDSQVASIGNKDFLYILAPVAGEIQVMAINGPGRATTFQSFDIAGPAKKANVAIDGNYLQGMATYVRH